MPLYPPAGSGSGAASGITVTPADDISATDVQAALEELDDEKLALAGDTMTGALVGIAGTTALPGIATGNTSTGMSRGTTLSLSFDGTQVWYGNAAQAGTARTGAGYTWMLEGEGTSTIAARQRTDNAGGPTFALSKTRGTTAAQTDVVTGDTLGTFRFDGRGGGGFVICASLSAAITETTPSSSAMGSRLVISANPTGSATNTEVARLDHATGLSMFGANPVINQNRHFRKRQYAAGALPTAASGDEIASSDIIAATLVSEGTQWTSPGVKVLNAVTNDTTISVPAGWAIAHVFFANTTANAVTGGIKIGTTSGATDVVVAQAVGASAIGHITDATILKRVFSRTAAQTLFVQDVTAWNSASLEFSFVLAKVF